MSNLNWKAREVITDVVDQVQRLAEQTGIDPATVCYVAARSFGPPDEDLIGVYEDAVIKLPGL